MTDQEFSLLTDREFIVYAYRVYDMNANRETIPYQVLKKAVALTNWTNPFDVRSLQILHLIREFST